MLAVELTRQTEISRQNSLDPKPALAGSGGLLDRRLLAPTGSEGCCTLLPVVGTRGPPGCGAATSDQVVVEMQMEQSQTIGRTLRWRVFLLPAG